MRRPEQHRGRNVYPRWCEIGYDAEPHPTGGKSEPVPARHVDFGDDLSTALLDRTKSELSVCIINRDTHAGNLTFLVGNYAPFPLGKSRGREASGERTNETEGQVSAGLLAAHSLCGADRSFTDADELLPPRSSPPARFQRLA